MDIPGYRIERKIGQGGMATVYLAIQESLDRPVVLKLMDTSRIESDEWTERFLTEGRLVASLHHPNIITIYDISLAGEQLFISMEYVEGGDLKQRMALPMSPDSCLDYVIKIGQALHAAHQHGIVHRDVKPANILFRDQETPLLTDFGIAKQIDGDKDLTSTGIFLGSPNYVSPEQADGLAVDGRSDIYSLGCILFEMLTGEKPFSAESVVEIVIQHKQSPVPQLPDEYRLFQPVLDRMMAKKREDRFRDCQTMVEFIDDFKLEYQRTFTNPEYDLTVAEKLEESAPQQVVKEPKKSHNTILMSVLILALLGNIALHFIGKNIANSPIKPHVPSLSVLPPVSPPSTDTSQTDEATSISAQTASPEVRQALLWLGKKSLEEFKLTDPPKDNAHYYFSRLLDIDSSNQEAQQGILNIAERYAVLAEQAIADNDHDKARSYIALGYQIDSENTSLQTIELLLNDLGNPSFLDTLLAIFSFK